MSRKRFLMKLTKLVKERACVEPEGCEFRN